LAIALVIDDSQDAADALCSMLLALGVQAAPAYGPRAAMLELVHLKPDIIFLDINLPGIDGFEVMAYLRRFPHLEKVPVVFVTSDDQPETARKAGRTGALLVMVKPASFEALEELLKRINMI
jgi:CheY-like chemotaxis protein